MGTSEFFRDYREIQKLEKAKRREEGAKALLDAGISFVAKNDGAHLIISHKGEKIDFWPGTGKWKHCLSSSVRLGYDLLSLLQYLESLPTLFNSSLVEQSLIRQRTKLIRHIQNICLDFNGACPVNDLSRQGCDLDCNTELLWWCQHQPPAPEESNDEAQ